jgi:hypothetical protein
MEADIAGDVSDSQATAAAEKAVAAAADDDEEAPEYHSNQQIQKETPSAKDVKAAEVASAKDKVVKAPEETTTTVKDVDVPKLAELAKKVVETTVKAAPPAPKKEATLKKAEAKQDV